MMNEEDEAFAEMEQRQSRRICIQADLNPYETIVRNNTLEEVALAFDNMKVLGDTAASFAAYVRGMKR